MVAHTLTRHEFIVVGCGFHVATDAFVSLQNVRHQRETNTDIQVDMHVCFHS